MAEAPESLAAKFPVPPSGFHHTRGVYNNGEFKDNGVSPQHLASHIAYNLSLRPGRALFVDGICVNQGYLSEVRCKQVESDLVGHTANRCTTPYH